MLISRISIFIKKSIMSIFFLIINKKKTHTFKLASQYLLNFIILLNTVFNLVLYFKLKIDPKMCTLKNLKIFRKPGRNFSKTFGNPGKTIFYLFFYHDALSLIYDFIYINT